MPANSLPGKVATAPPRPSKIEPTAPERLAASIGARLERADAAKPVTGVTLRAQHVQRGDLFAALPGSRAHGADFAHEALRAGAVAVLTDPAGAERESLKDVPVLVHEDPRAVLGAAAAEVYGNPSQRLKVLGVTGTSGKTTTTYMLEAGLAAAGLRTGLVGGVEMRIAGRRIESALTTPEAPDLQALFAVMLEQGVTHVPMEVSSHALALGRVGGTHYAAGAFTNLSQDHLDFHPDMEDYFRTKAKLFDGRADVEVVCTDTPWGERLIKPATITVSPRTRRRGRPATSWSPAAARRPSTPTATAASWRWRSCWPARTTWPISLTAIAMLDAIGIDEKAIVAGLAKVQVPGRMERVDLGQDFTAVVDYSHKPAAVALALDAVRARADGRVIVVLGCGGDRDAAKRPLMGEAAAVRADLTIVTDDNPRSEQASDIRAQMLAGVPADRRDTVVEIADRREAIRYAVGHARTGDVVVVAGKGHETGQEVAGVIHPFSDRDELTAAIGEAAR
ncbi:UDP-N-acetylmuramoyl-L-alanyl-D-glutamate--2,6-diaminopimelate ligase [Kutzneria sp. 744]|uniref:UDP-N-acetylmuramoyl-L-alanyl-D-glutamate--2, 6-diaminopimelate ligase n=1 Tax=Kutzneria sp. (strain 744) TaxID=345341 RepID=UPI0003EED063|nr:UDP-N-acetylmuramoyl-L-alanyl-D-glutamate--2,6-diaminopimelate ligase [Kutzneria sp. 744]EWM16586.1 UDP-N-acetylmuramoylalanyl-D-glutamate-2, 6-diaminopimelate ligase [Kutzneria sp. 744]